MNTLSIFINLGDNVDIKENKFDNIDCIHVKRFEDIPKCEQLINLFPNLLEIENDNQQGIELFLKLTNDINQKNFEESQRVEDVFAKKKPFITYGLIAINIIMYLFIAFVGKEFLTLILIFYINMVH